MNKLAILFVGAILILGFACQPNKKDIKTPEKGPKEIGYYTSDSVQVFGDLYVTNMENPTILLFHQARANARSEYGPIIPELLAMEYNVLAIDQRNGGQLFGSYNRTVAQIPLNSYSYCDAYPEMEEALNYLNTNGFKGRKIAWGSSYSAALVIKLAALHSDEIAGVLAFSPASGEPMDGCRPEEYFSTLKAPLLLLRPESEMEYGFVRTQFDSAAHTGHQTYVAVNGKHGSSMLVKSRTSEGSEKTWKVVKDFLKSLQ